MSSPTMTPDPAASAAPVLEYARPVQDERPPNARVLVEHGADGSTTITDPPRLPREVRDETLAWIAALSVILCLTVIALLRIYAEGIGEGRWFGVFFAALAVIGIAF